MIRVHNLMEVKALIKEAYARGSEHELHNVTWLSHAGEYLCRSLVSLTEFELILPNNDSLIIEVLS